VVEFCKYTRPRLVSWSRRTRTTMCWPIFRKRMPYGIAVPDVSDKPAVQPRHG